MYKTKQKIESQLMPNVLMPTLRIERLGLLLRNGKVFNEQ